MSLELKRKKLELSRVSQAKEEQAFKIEELLDQIERLKAHMKIQEEAIQKIRSELMEMEKD